MKGAAVRISPTASAKSNAGIAATDSLKSGTNSKPKSMSAETHRQLTNDVMKAARGKGNIRFCAQMTLHELARTSALHAAS